MKLLAGKHHILQEVVIFRKSNPSRMKPGSPPRPVDPWATEWVVVAMAKARGAQRNRLLETSWTPPKMWFGRSSGSKILGLQMFFLGTKCVTFRRCESLCEAFRESPVTKWSDPSRCFWLGSSIHHRRQSTGWLIHLFGVFNWMSHTVGQLIPLRSSSTIGCI